MRISIRCKWHWFSINGSNIFFFYISYRKGFGYLKHSMTQINIKVTQMCKKKFNQPQVIKLEGKHPQTAPASLARLLQNWPVSFMSPWVNSPRGDPRDEITTQSRSPWQMETSRFPQAHGNNPVPARYPKGHHSMVSFVWWHCVHFITVFPLWERQ